MGTNPLASLFIFKGKPPCPQLLPSIQRFKRGLNGNQVHTLLVASYQGGCSRPVICCRCQRFVVTPTQIRVRKYNSKFTKPLVGHRGFHSDLSHPELNGGMCPESFVESHLSWLSRRSFADGPAFRETGST